MNIYIGNIPRQSTEEELKELFSSFGEVTKVNIIKDKFTGESRGFGFIEMADEESADNAINELNGQDFQGRALTVSKAKPREDRPRTGGGYNRGGGAGGGSRGGFGGSRGGFGGSRGGSGDRNGGGRGGFGGNRGGY
jgi:RNA recognition motif-containing protein